MSEEVQLDAALSGLVPQRELGAPLHHQIFLVLREGIMSGRYAPGEALPTEAALTRLFRVSRITVRRALQTLEDLDLIERRRGRGTFVRADSLPEPLHLPVSSMVQSIRAFGERTDVHVLEFGYVEASPAVKEMLKLAGGPVQRAVRLRSRKGRPLLHLTTYVPEDLGRTYDREAMNATPLYELLRRAGSELQRGEQIVTATLADPAVAERLDVTIGSPLLEVRRVNFDQNGHAVEYLMLLASPDRFQVRMVLAGDGGVTLG